MAGIEPFEVPSVSPGWIAFLVIGLLIALGIFAFVTWSQNQENGDGSNRRRTRSSRESSNGTDRTWIDKYKLVSEAKWYGTMPEVAEGVAFRLGHATSRPIRGIYIRPPGIYKILAVSLRQVTLEVPEVEIPIEDGAIIGVKPELTVAVEDSHKAVTEVEDYKETAISFARIALYEVLTGKPFEQVTAAKGGNNPFVGDLLKQLKAALSPIGLRVVVFHPVSFTMSDSLREASEQAIQARVDAKAAERELEVAKSLLKAAAEYARASNNKLSEGEVALELRRYSTLKDMRGGNVMVSDRA